MSTTRAYEEVVDFIAAGTSPEGVVAFRASEATRERVWDLVAREKTTGLSSEETGSWTTTCRWNTSCGWRRPVPVSTWPMSRTYISVELRRLTVARATHLCEYCLIHEGDTFAGGEVDHVIGEKHNGPTQATISLTPA